MKSLAALALSGLVGLALPIAPAPAQIAPRQSNELATPRPPANAVTGAESQIRLGGGQPAGQQPAGGGKMMTSITPPETIRIMKGVGFSGLEPHKFENQDHVMATIDGTNTFIWHENCADKGGCATLWFMVNFGKQESGQDYINSYNGAMYYTKLYTTKSGDLILTMAMPLAGGVTEAHVEFIGRLWVRVFKEALEYKPS